MSRRRLISILFALALSLIAAGIGFFYGYNAGHSSHPEKEEHRREVLSAPVVRAIIIDGHVEINANSYEEAEGLAKLFRLGSLGFELEEM